MSAIRKHIATCLRAIVARLDPPPVVSRIDQYITPGPWAYSNGSSSSSGPITVRQGDAR